WWKWDLWSPSLFPFRSQQGVDQFVGPLPLHELVLHEMRFSPHTQLLHHPHRGHVASVAPGEDTPQQHLLEADPEDLGGGLGGVALPLVGGTEEPAHLTGAMDDTHVGE